MTEHGVPSMDLDELERLLETATPGPWDTLHPSNARWDTLSIHPLGIAANYADARLIVAAVNSLPALIAAARRAEELEKALRGIRDNRGKVCDTFEICEHPACADSYGSWADADQALRATLAGDRAP